MFWWTKKDWEIKILNDRINTLEDRLKACAKNIDKLERIIKYSKDEPSYSFHHMIYGSSLDGTACNTTSVRLYIEREEYDVCLKELCGRNYDTIVDNAILRVVDNIATLACDVLKDHKNIRYSFYIDYKKGTYICMESEVKNEPKTET